MIYYTAWGRDNKVIISKKPLGDNPFVAFQFGIIEADNEEEAEEKSKEIFREWVNIPTIEGYEQED